MFIWPHGLHVDREGNVWGTDAASPEAVAMAAKAGGKFGHQVIKFSPEGKVLMTLGEAGVPGSDERHFISPSAVAVAANGDIFVADGHGVNENNRVVKFSKDGKFIKAWGKTGYAPGEFRTLHGIAIDSRGRVFVADRRNNRIQIFDQEGKHLVHVAAVRHAERDRVRRQGSDLRRRLRVGQRDESRIGAGDPHRRRTDRMGHSVHPRLRRRSADADGQRAGVRDGG